MPTKSSPIRSSRPSRSSFPLFLPFILGTAAVSLVLMGLLVGVQTLSSVQNLRYQAATAPVVQLRMHGQTVAAGELRVDFLVNTGTYKAATTLVTAKLQGIPASEVRLDLKNNLNLEAVSQTVTGQTDGTLIKFAQKAPADVNKPVMTRGQELVMASVFIKRPQGGEFTLAIDRAAANTKIAIVGQPTAVTDSTASQKFTVVTTTPRSLVTPAPTPTTTIVYVYATPQPPDRGLQRSCNQYCADKNECQNGLTCQNNRCRNPRNVGSESCANPPTPRPTPRPVAVVAPPIPAKGDEPTPRPTVSPSPSPSSTPKASSSPLGSTLPSSTPVASSPATIYDEKTLRVTPTPAAKPKVTPIPTPKATTADSTNSRRLLTAGVILLLGLGIVIPVGVYLYRNVG